MATPIIWDIVETHLDEAAFLLKVHERSLDSPRYRLREVETGPERRLLAHIDGLVVGGEPVARELLIPSLEPGTEPEVTCAAALALLQAGMMAGCERIVELLDEAEGAHRQALIRALQLTSQPGLVPWLRGGPRAETWQGVAARLEVLAAHGADMRAFLPGLLRSPHEQVVIGACRLAPHGCEAPVLRELERIGEGGSSAAHSALESGAILGLPNALERLAEGLQRSPSTTRRRLLPLVAALHESQSTAMVSRFAKEAEPDPDVVWALGFCGRVDAAQHLFERLSHPTLGPLMAEAFAAITGLPQTRDYWSPPADSDQELPPLAVDLETTPLPSQDAQLLVPRVDAIERWWHTARANFDSEQRYRQGEPIETGALPTAVLEATTTRRREVLGLQLAVATRGRCHINTRALCSEQRRRLRTAVSSSRPQAHHRGAA